MAALHLLVRRLGRMLTQYLPEQTRLVLLLVGPDGTYDAFSNLTETPSELAAALHGFADGVNRGSPRPPAPEAA